MASTHNTLTVCRASAGTGKTYTLAANYVALLFDDVSYRSILAVTFTNKATQEMKDRILLFLDNIANNTGVEANEALKAIRTRMTRNAKASDDELRQKAKDCYIRMLEDYDNIHISTIDTFLLQLLNGLGQMLDDASAGAKVELDLEKLIAEAVDNLLTNPVHASYKLTTFLISYVNDRLEDGKDWNIRNQLISLAKRMYTESVQQMEASQQIVFDADAILKYKANTEWRGTAAVKELSDYYQFWRNWTTAGDGIKGESAMDKFISEIAQYLDGPYREDWLFRGLTDSPRKHLSDNGGADFLAKYAYDPSRGRQVREALLHLDELCAACRREYNTWKGTVANLNDMALMSAVREEIRALLVEKNRVLLAQTANTLHQAMAVGDADFILEKAGIRYRHIMLDEFQDTSVLQWENFRPLLEEILASGGSVFIVGDVKQSIYRWRNGDWELMANLSPKTPHLGAYFKEDPLIKNYRSSREVVQFNLKLFQKISTAAYGNAIATEQYNEHYKPELLANYYKASHQGGYVQLEFVEENGALQLPKMFGEIETRLMRGEVPSDMLILVRTHKEAAQVVACFRDLAQQSSVLGATSIISCDSFHLDASLSVQFVIQSLRWLILHDQVAKTYIQLTFPQFEMSVLEQLDASIPPSELIEEIIKIIPSQSNNDLVYINTLMDQVHDYIAQNGTDPTAFLVYWEDELHKQSIAAPTADAIRIMTIHSAKGLEAKNVFIPFCSWEMQGVHQSDLIWCQAKARLKAPVAKLNYIPVQMSAALENSEYEEEYLEECRQRRMDNLNMLYVALTRAKDTLYIYGEVSEEQIEKNSTVAALLCKALRNGVNDLSKAWSFGTPVTVAPTAVTSSGKMIDRFEFESAKTLQAGLHIGLRPISFRMSRESLDSLRFGEQNKDRTARIDLGNVCHYIMEHIAVREDQDAAINDALMSGLIADEDTESEIRHLIDSAWTNPQMCDWFSGKWELLREVSFFIANEELRPDRVMIDRQKSRVIVLDYKFGQREAEYPQQVRKYMRLMAELGYCQVVGYLWYAQEAQLEQVVMR